MLRAMRVLLKYEPQPTKRKEKYASSKDAFIDYFFLATSLSSFTYAGLPTLIPRKILFGNPVKDLPQISPGGLRIAYLAPSDKGFLNIWIRTRGKEDDRMITNDATRGIFDFTWGFSDDHILFFQDNAGDENDHLKAVDVKTTTVVDLTPYKDVRATNLLKDDEHPDEVMVGLNRRDPQVFDMYRVNLKTKEIRLEAQNPGDVIGWTTDRKFQIRCATAFRPDDLSSVIRVRDALDQPWRDLLVTPFEKTPFLGQYNGGSLAVGFTEDGKHLYAATCLTSDTTQLVKLDVATGKVLEVLAEHPKGDMLDENDRYEVMLHKNTGNVLAAWFQYMKPEVKVIDPEVAVDFALLEKQESGVFGIVSRDRADSFWIVKYVNDTKQDVYFLYDRKNKKLEFLMDPYPELSKYKMSQVRLTLIPASDGIGLPSYLWLPVGVVPKNLSMVLLPHGGPWWRDNWGFDPEVQWLTNRGYAVLQVNFRGSTGFGVKFMNAGTGGWCVGRMQQDLTDAVRWAIAQGIADPARIVIMGASYGGYATLCGITHTPELYSCAVDIVGPSDVAHALRSFPAYWGPVKKRWIRRIGFNVEEDEQANRKISPLYHIDQIKVPLFIAHGSNDPRVKQAASDRIVQAMREKKLAVTYVVYPDEGHGLSREPNLLDFYSRVEEFLGKCLKGRIEPREKVEGTSAEER